MKMTKQAVFVSVKFNLC